MHLVECAFGGLQEADRILGIPLGLVETTNLVLELLADSQTGRVIGCLVDPQST